MPLYLDGIKGGSNIESWDAELFFFGDKLPPIGEKLNLKQLKEHDFTPWLGAKPQSDYYILREY